MTSTPRVAPIRQGVHFAATFDRAKLHREPRHLRHIDRIVENDDATMADQPVARRKSLIVVGRIEQRPGKISAERSAALDRPRRPPAQSAAANPIDDFAERQTESGLLKPAVADVPGDLDRHRPARTPEAETGIKIGAAIKNRRHRHEG
ncbi:MAG: hypothetical protein USCAAHI_02359 [Beijerinckiaceae bacterium]|nr:MAG: hypothetical protein USCAAHI_02359 [Beijerinckiaceae bacterium]